jgi:hypothetical protein
MKKIVILLLAIYISFSALAQTSSQWFEINDSVSGISFNMPEIPLFADTLNSKLYSCVVDSMLALETHIYDSARFNMYDTVFNQVLIDENSDTLRAIAKIVLFATNSNLTQIIDIETNGIPGLEIGISYKSLASNIPLHTFIRYYLIGNNFFSFSVTGSETEMLRGINTKDLFFNSIDIH